MKHIKLRPTDFPEAQKILHDCEKEGKEKAEKGGKKWDLEPRQREVLSKAKLEEQGGFCGYCECEIEAPHWHIDHFYQRSKCPQRTWDWNNMVLSCVSDDHCGRYKDAKGKISSEELIDPHSEVEDPRNLITFVLEARSGRENSRVIARPVGGNQRANNTIQALNLNDRKLSETRRNYLRTYEGEINELRKQREEGQDLSRVQEEAERLFEKIQKGPFSSSLLCCASFLLDLE